MGLLWDGEGRVRRWLRELDGSVRRMTQVLWNALLMGWRSEAICDMHRNHSNGMCEENYCRLLKSLPARSFNILATSW